MVSPDSIRKELRQERKQRRRLLFDRPGWHLSVGLPGATGALLFLSDYPLHLWWLQLFAFVPLFHYLVRYCPSVKDAVKAGAVLGVFYTLPTMLVLEFPPLMAGGLGLYITLLWAVMVGLIYYVLPWPQPLGGLAAGAVAAIVEWLDITVIPIWGTAQCFARVWTAAPYAVQFVAIAGIVGLVFALIATQALLTVAAQEWSCGVRSVATAVVLVTLLVITNTVMWSRNGAGRVRVAAIGWTSDDLPAGMETPAGIVLDGTYIPLLEKAVGQGAKIVVSPEVGFRLTGLNRSQLLTSFRDLARQHEVWLAVGVFDVLEEDNRILFFDPKGKLRGEYRKTHLIPTVETYKAGDGTLVTLDAPELRMGGMICQDDNFTDLARAYGRQKVQIMVVPTNDWEQVKNHHLENSLFRPIENGYGIVRAASNGISVIADARGEVLARMDHFEEGPGFIVAEMDLFEGGSVYAEVGNWLPIMCVVFLIVGFFVEHRTRRYREEEP